MDSFTPMYRHLLERSFNFNTYRVLGVDEEERSITFPLFNLSGQLVGYQIYRPDADKMKKNDPREGRYFTRLKEQKVGVWGLESWCCSNALFVTEGIFDACKLNWVAGVSAVAVLTSTVSPQLKNWFHVVRQFRPVYVIADGDAGGRKLRNLGHNFHTMPDGFDLGDVSEQYAMDVVKKFVDTSEIKNVTETNCDCVARRYRF